MKFWQRCEKEWLTKWADNVTYLGLLGCNQFDQQNIVKYKTLQNKAERSNLFKQNFLMSRCAHVHCLEHILIVSINKIPLLIKQKIINFYVILQTILCVHYEQKRLIEMVKISTRFHTTNNDACLKA